MDNDTPLEPYYDLMDDDIVNVLKSCGKGIVRVSKFTHQQLLQKPDWDTNNGWKYAEQKQLDAMEIETIFGAPNPT